MEAGGPQATVAQLVALVLVTMALLTVAGWLGVGQHSTAPSIGASTAPKISHAGSPPSLAAAAGRR